MTNLFDALEFCLREIEEGGDLETTIARFPEFKDELLPILETSVKARAMAVPEPSQEVIRRSRSRIMQRAAELREMRVAPRWRTIPFFQRLAISFTLAAIFLMSGNGLLSASASALPGEQLYTVKRGWESVRLFFIFDAKARELLANEFENERLHETGELLAIGSHEVVEFAGVFMVVNGQTYISGLPVVVPATMQLPENGDAVIVSGRTNADGYVELITLNLLPDGAVVPVGNPIEIEVESHQTDNNAPSSTSDPNPSGIPTATKTVEYEVKGTIESISETGIVLNGMVVYFQNANIIGKLCVGSKIEVIGYYDPEGRFIALEIEGASSCPSILGTGNSSNDSNTLPSTIIQGSNSENSNDQESSDNNSNNDDNDDDDDDDDDNSGKGGGGGDDDD